VLPRRTKYRGHLFIVFLVTVLLNLEDVDEDTGVDDAAVAVVGTVVDEDALVLVVFALLAVLFL
jgi:hypothetical protein